jgi:hypothetical protein
MKPDGMETVELELKYCERCGSLWLRLKGAQEVYCTRCLAKIAQMGGWWKSKGKPRLPVRTPVKNEDRCPELVAVIAEAGEA